MKERSADEHEVRDDDMAFMIHTVEGGRVPAWEYLPAGAITPQVGMALTQTGGNLALASGATAPTYISMRQEEAALTAGDIIPVIRVLDSIVFETTFSAAATAVKVGDKVTIHTDGLQVTATKTAGVAEVVSMEGTAAGSRVRVRFPGVTAAAAAG